MTRDTSALERERERAERNSLWPVYKGLSFNLWRPDTGSYLGWAKPREITDLLRERRRRGKANRLSAFSEFDGTWIEDPQTLPCLGPRIAFRDVARATDNRTVIAALIPGKRVIVHLAPSVLWPRGGNTDEAYLLGVLSSMILDWFARCVVELHLTYDHFNSLPIPRPELDDPDPSSPGLRLRNRVIHLAGRLATAEPDHPGFREWAAAVGVEAGSVRSEEQKTDLIEELDAVVALLYGLDDADLRVIYDTFHTGADYSARCRRVIDHCRTWRERLKRTRLGGAP